MWQLLYPHIEEGGILATKIMTELEFKEYLMAHSKEIICVLADVLYPVFKKDKVSLDASPKIETMSLHSTSVESQTINLLRSFGMNRNLNGFSYIVSAIKILLKDGRPKKVHMGKTLYPDIAKEYNVNNAQIERSIRTAIKNIIEKEDGAQVAKTLGYDDARMVSKTGSFLLAVAEKVYESSAI